jgi:hypothetical protein
LRFFAVILLSFWNKKISWIEFFCKKYWSKSKKRQILTFFENKFFAFLSFFDIFYEWKFLHFFYLNLNVF